MTLRGILLAALVLPLCSPAIGKGVQDIEKLRQHVLFHTTEHYRETFGRERFENSIQIHVGQLDPRLRLYNCDDNLTFEIQEPLQNIRNATVRTSCVGARRWTVYVPVKINMYVDVLVTSRTLQKGDIVAEEDIDYRRVNITSNGYGHIEDVSRVRGMQLKRPLKPGDVLRLSHLAKPKIVHRGQTVRVSSASRFFSIETSAVALSSGHLGDNIKVKNERSNRVVEARIVAPGKVTVAAR